VSKCAKDAGKTVHQNWSLKKLTMQPQRAWSKLVSIEPSYRICEFKNRHFLQPYVVGLLAISTDIQRWARKLILLIRKSQIRKFLGHSAIKIRKFLRCASPQLANPLICND
jgi:hypothetical protein